MPERVKESWLKGSLARLNSKSKRKYHFYIAGIPSSYTLATYENNSGGISTVGQGLTKKEMYYALDLLNSYLDADKREPFEKLKDNK